MQIKLETLANRSFYIFLFTAILTERSIIGRMCFLIFVLVAILQMIRCKTYINAYIVLEVLFILYCGCQILWKVPVYRDISLDRLKTLSICMVFNFLFINYIKNSNDFWKVIKSIIKIFAYALILVVIINMQWLLSGARSSESAGIRIGGVVLGSLNAVSIGWYAGIGLLLSVLVYSRFNDMRKMWGYFSLFLSIILISGTRKIIIIIPIAYIIHKLIKSKSKYEILVLLKNIILSLFIGVILLMAVLYIPFLYNTVGNRIESVILYLLTGEGNEASMLTRFNLIEVAINAFQQRPIYGWGLDNFKYVFYGGKYYSHNNFLEIAVSGGAVGFVIYYLKYLYLFVRLFKMRNYQDALDKKVSLGIIIAIFSFVIMEYWQVTYFNRLFLLLNLLSLGVDKRFLEEGKCNRRK